MKNTVLRATVATLVAASVTAAVRGQGGGSYAGSGSGGSRLVSPSVVSALWSHDDADHVPVLEFLVLFRGSPGWSISQGVGTNGYNFAGSNGLATSYTFATSGGVTVSIDSISSVPTRKLTVVANLATILDRQITPDEVNVVLVDGVDAPDGRPSIETRYIAPRLEGDGDAIARVFNDFPELKDFLRCDAALPDALPGVSDIQLRMMRRMPTMCGQASPR